MFIYGLWPEIKLYYYYYYYWISILRLQIFILQPANIRAHDWFSSSCILVKM